ncbi:hypothetical protein [Streptomyces lydicus]|uniref:hypothetical protein n=1 Tax=Streptomyces lydicus TaxID=47763 RepID=UPI00378AEA39
MDWRIAEWPPTGTKNKTADSGTIALDTDGHGRTEDQKLPDGHYKLYWNFDGEKGAAKHKVFWVDCADQGGTGPSATVSAPASPSSTASASATPANPSASGTPSESGTSSAQPGAPAKPSASATPDSGNLAETGSNAGVLTGVAVALLAAGGGVTLAMRRRARVQRRTRSASPSPSRRALVHRAAHAPAGEVTAGPARPPLTCRPSRRR